MDNAHRKILIHQISARRPGTVVLLALIWLGLVLIWIGLDTVWWIPALIGCLTLPALLEAWRNDTAGLSLDTRELSWTSARQSGTVSVTDIDHLQFDTRLDFAVNARLYLINGSVLRLPIEAVPPYQTFSAALDQAGIRHERHHFSVF